MTRILNWIKANLIIVILCAAMVICLPTFYVLGEMMNGKVRASLKSRAESQLKTIRNVERTSVEIDPLLPGTKSIKMDVTLNKAVLRQYEQVRKQIKSDSEAIVAEAIAVNQKPVLSDRIFPKPSDAEAHLPFELHRMYLDAHEALIRSANAGMPMLPPDVASLLNEYRETYQRTQLNVEPGTQLKPSEQDQLDEAMTRRRMALYTQTATEYSVYADSTVFGLADWKMERGTAPNERERFNWQHQLWVNTDLMNAVSNANQIPGSGGELSAIVGQPGSVVKRIVSITLQPLASNMKSGSAGDSGGLGEGEEYEWIGFSEGGGNSGMMGGKGASPRGAPKAPEKKKTDNSNPNQPIERDYSEAITGRISNGLYDVRRGQMVVIVDSARFPRLIDAINSTNFMTVTNVNLRRIDIKEHLAQGFYYGNDPVVEATLDIETLWLRDWTTQWMSDDVKDWLGIPKETDQKSGNGG